jgi:methylenetetrahydrofolate dehydrogenase (NADP+) / methenyltetrahydrofolate cyclohydrolase
MEHIPIILDGKKAQAHYAEMLRTRIQKLTQKPKLVIFFIGNDERSRVYIERKKAFGESVGVSVEIVEFSSDVSQDEVLLSIQNCNERNDVSGIIIQLPLPAQLNEKILTAAVLPEKDVDGLHPYNLGKLAKGELDGLIPATAQGILLLLSFFEISVSGKNIAVIGRSILVGRPVSLLLLAHNATVTMAHSKTKNLSEITLNADIIISAAGVPNLIRGNMIKQGAIVVDVGTTAVKMGDELKLSGDALFDEVSKKASAITPVPGGVGPMTVYSLFDNVIRAAEKQL